MAPHDAVAVIAGGGSGLGRATAHRLHRQGRTVVLLDLPGSQGQDAAAALGERAHFVPADATDPDQVRQAFAYAAGHGPVRAAVNCAGIATPGRILGKRGALPAEDFRRVIAINLLGTFHVLSAAAAVMAGNTPDNGDRGVIVCTASIAAYDGQIGQAAYAASKGGVVSLTLAAARDLADSAIRVVTVAPGLFDTPLLSGLPEKARTELGAAVPHPSRLGSPDEYASLVGHILDNSMLNGEVIRLDGALRMPLR
ncbi:SDR family NAD(P)-dependent oxidoreductase [Streptomyces sp. MBT62]|uniref:SDR family NAD(P)-dependent oxidoreductase n=1 Tax=Streptomyces sp. MBT62 TaxID=2800410 RepID=UPI00190DEDB2|nr:SDR family NAD(P)-dependent oxidoreductase [Streptomyces sp. MBT62]MBK3562289.1 SDR family NAD(P)-dependent oxidoreductase [Streptomyces sp. MBT62]